MIPGLYSLISLRVGPGARLSGLRVLTAVSVVSSAPPRSRRAPDLCLQPSRTTSRRMTDPVLYPHWCQGEYNCFPDRSVIQRHHPSPCPGDIRGCRWFSFIVAIVFHNLITVCIITDLTFHWYGKRIAEVLVRTCLIFIIILSLPLFCTLPCSYSNSSIFHYKNDMFTPPRRDVVSVFNVCPYDVELVIWTHRNTNTDWILPRALRQ